MGVISLGNKFSPERLEAACGRALNIGGPTYKSIKSILDMKLDTVDPSSEEPATQTPEHPNIRGAAYFQPALALDDKER